MGRNDIDTFKVTGEPGKVLTIKAIPKNEQTRLALIFFNEDREKLGGFSAKNQGAVVKGKILVDEEYPDIYFRIKHLYDHRSSQYVIKIKSSEPKK